MRNPPRKAAIFALGAVLAGTVAWLGVRLYDVLDPKWLAGLVFTAGFTLAVTMLVLLVEALLLARGMARLAAGVGRIAQWHVTAAEWDAFRAADGPRAASGPGLRNDLRIRKATPRDGVEVIVGDKALIVDGSYHVLRVHGLPELRAIGWLDNSAVPGRPPDCLEFSVAYPRGRYGGTVTMCLRVPVPESAWPLARQVYDRFAPRLGRGPIALRNPRRTLQVCGAIAAGGLGAAGWGWIAAESAGWNLYEAPASLLLLLLGGAMAVLFAVVLAGLTLLLRPKPSGSAR